MSIIFFISFQSLTSSFSQLAPLDVLTVTMASLVQEPVSRLLSQQTRLPIAIVPTVSAARAEPAPVTRDGLPRHPPETLPNAALVLLASSRILLGIANGVARAVKLAPTRPVPALNVTPASPSTRSRISSAVSLSNVQMVNSPTEILAPSVMPLALPAVDPLPRTASSVQLEPSSIPRANVSPSLLSPLVVSVPVPHSSPILSRACAMSAHLVAPPASTACLAPQVNIPMSLAQSARLAAF